jgi:hypothetical protein
MGSLLVRRMNGCSDRTTAPGTIDRRPTSLAEALPFATSPPLERYNIMTDNSPPADTPSDANAECVGPSAEDAGKASGCAGCPNQQACSSGAFNTPEAKAKAQEEAQKLHESLHNVSHTILVLSGKGGVGKSTVSSQLAHTLASQGYAVGLLDVDLCGPSAPRMVLGDKHRTAQITQSASGGWIPVYSPEHPNLACMSISFLLQEHDSAVVWRGKLMIASDVTLCRRNLFIHYFPKVLERMD